ncbi:phage tail protein [Pseudomonas sp. S5D5]|uniref:phage tail protein n=1 Tax=Pseudomonas sp. S5D5 TaxID=2083056 RepID=UPI000D1073EA|nr:phage tail protein [Pseudomonas sp. S5D5]
MGAVITLAGESLIAQKQAANAALKVSRFIFANVPGLNPTAPVDRAAPKPMAAQIVYTHQIPSEHVGYVNPNQVVYSAQIGSDVGDWDFNWIGLETADGVLFAVAYVPMQQKRRNIPPLQIGNNLTRNFLMAFDGALALTGITIDASTWQHDFTVRFAGVDERERLSNRDVYGRACFFGSSLQLEKVGGSYQLKPGTAYIEGIRLVQSATLPVVPPALPAKAWLDVVLQRELSDVVASWTVVFGAEKADYIDALGVRHYCVALADLTDSSMTDRRPVEAIDGPLVQQFALRNGDYEQLRARATTKDDVKLGNLPNAISDDPESNSSVVLATTKAVKASAALIWTALANVVSGATVVGRAAVLATARKITLGGALTGNVGFDGSADVTLTATLNQATEAVVGGAKVATQQLTNVGADDTVYVTPKKLRWGFLLSLTANGYVVFPTWLGGLIIQWARGVHTNVGDSTQTIALPLAFPSTNLFSLSGTIAVSNVTSDMWFQTMTASKESVVVVAQWSGTGSVSAGAYPQVLAIGY